MKNHRLNNGTIKAIYKIIISVALSCLCLTISFAGPASVAQSNHIHCVTDISHEFTFYFDGRFGRNYVADNGIDVRNWGTLHKYDFSNVNLLILQSSASPCPYLPEDIEAVRKFLEEGGGVVILGDYSLFRREPNYRLNTLARHFGAEFVNESAMKPLSGCSILEREEIDSYSPKIIKLDESADWEILVKDTKDRTVMARRRVGKGFLVIASRSLCGHKPDAGDPINDAWWKPLLKQITANKPVDPKRRPRNQMPENKTQRQRLPIQYSDYMKSHADAIYAVYDQCFPVIQQVMGVPPSEGMLTNLILLPNGEDVPHVVRMAKPMYIFEQLRKEKPDIIACYFQTKRKFATPEKIKKYTADDSVAVLSIAMGRDLFPWFRSLGITVNRSIAQIEIEF